MQQFEYLLVIVGIILGLGIAHILSGLVDYVQERHRVRWSALQLVWMLVLFLLQVQYWYVMFHVADIGRDFSRYLAALLFPTFLYLASGVLVPKVSHDETRVLDLRDRYADNQRWFFALCAMGLITLIVYAQLVAGATTADLKNSLHDRYQQFRLAGLVLVLLLMFVRGWAHSILTVLSLLALLSFVLVQMLSIDLGV